MSIAGTSSGNGRKTSRSSWASTGRVLAALANVPDRQRCDGFPQPVIQGKHPVVAVPVFSRPRHKVRHTIKELSLTT